jgi:UPF0755 protein
MNSLVTLLKNILGVLTALAIAAVAVAGSLWVQYQTFIRAPLAISGDRLVIEVPRGVGLRKVTQELVAAGVLPDPYGFLALAHHSRKAGQIKSGEYEIRAGMTPPQLLDLLTSGKVIQHALTLVEGWTFRQALAAVAADPVLSGDLGGLTGEEIMVRIGHPGEHPEGRLFPDTYLFPRGTAAIDLIRRAYARMETVLHDEWERRAAGLPFDTPYEALVLASVVEKETGLAAERLQIAGVFVRRLIQGMKLQTDPTVIYGMGAGFDGNIRRSDLTADTPYNTYVRAGLPPTPIALPGREAIHAVLQPAPGDSLYFVARGDGSHAFSATLEEHNRAVRQYQLGGQ